MAKYKMYCHYVWCKDKSIPQATPYELILNTRDAAVIMAQSAIENIAMLSHCEVDELDITLQVEEMPHEAYLIRSHYIHAIVAIYEVGDTYCDHIYQIQ